MKKISKLSFAIVMNHSKGRKNYIPNRLKRQFFIFNIILPNEISINDIYGKIRQAYFNKKRSESVYKITNNNFGLLKRMKSKFQPTPTKFHYT